MSYQIAGRAAWAQLCQPTLLDDAGAAEDECPMAAAVLPSDA
jgi:hypothetical protein